MANKVGRLEISGLTKNWRVPRYRKKFSVRSIPLVFWLVAINLCGAIGWRVRGATR